jgi:hypothetical protein
MFNEFIVRRAGLLSGKAPWCTNLNAKSAKMRYFLRNYSLPYRQVGIYDLVCRSIRDERVCRGVGVLWLGFGEGP